MAVTYQHRVIAIDFNTKSRREVGQVLIRGVVTRGFPHYTGHVRRTIRRMYPAIKASDLFELVLIGRVSTLPGHGIHKARKRVR